jgi:hypothetical protein
MELHEVVDESVSGGSSRSDMLIAAWSRYLDFFFLGIGAPDFLASFKAMETACLQLFTFFLPPDFRNPILSANHEWKARVTRADVADGL